MSAHNNVYIATSIIKNIKTPTSKLGIKPNSNENSMFYRRAVDVTDIAYNKSKNGKTIKKSSIFDQDYTVLIVDDNEAIRQVTGSKIHALNINTVAVSSG